MNNFVVAIDGPAGSGKSSISKIIAKKMNFTHLDTGAMYRAVTLEALNRKIDLACENQYDFIDDISIIYSQGIVYLNGKDVSKDIRSEEVTNNVSTTAKLKRVRDKMVYFQRESAKNGKIIMDGRDIGTVVLPNANLKIFLTASAEARAKRRCLENEASGIESNFETILKEIKERDYKDSHREISPLKMADDAILIDTTEMTIDDVCNKIYKLIDERLKKMEEFKMEDLDMPKKLHVGDKVNGTVVVIKDKTIYLDIHNFTEGTMHLDHYTKDKSIESFKGLVKVGDVINCEVAKISEDNIYLSRLNQIVIENFKYVTDAKAEEKDIEVKVLKEVKDKGYIVTYKDNQLFMPKSMATPSVVVGQNITVRIVEVDEKKRNAVVSRRIIEQEEYQDKRSKEFDSIQVGDVLKGTVAKVEKYGALIKFDLVQGLLKTGQLSHVFVDITNELKVGQEIEVKVIHKADGKIELSRKALLKTPFEEYTDSHKVSDKVTGKVVNKLGFGLLLELAPNVKGLLHSSEYSHNPNDNYNNYVKIGDEVEVAIIAINKDKEKISLSRKALMDNPWERVTAKVNDLVDVTITAITDSGLNVACLGVDGFVPKQEALLEENKDISNYYAIGDTSKAIITDINPKEWKLKLSIKKYLAKEERKSFEKYLDDNTEATVSLGDMLKEVLK